MANQDEEEAGTQTIHTRVNAPASGSSSSSSLLPALPLQTLAWEWNGAEAHAAQATTLTAQTLSLTVGAKATHLALEDVVGVERVDHGLIVHAYPVATGCWAGNPPKREYKRTTLTPIPGTSTMAAGDLATEWHRAFQRVLSDLWVSYATAVGGSPSVALRPRAIMILINPASGAGNAAANLETLQPMLRQSGVAFTVRKTAHANHAYELMRDMDLDSADAPTDVVCVSGDGLVHEVVNGIMQRPDWRRASTHLRIGHIGGGSGNGLASAICAQAMEKIDLVSSMWLILKGYTRPMDVFSLKQPGEAIKFGFLSFNYGVVSDIDLESETMRYLGNARFTVAAIRRFCCLKTYQAKLEFLAADEGASAEPGQGHSRSAGSASSGQSNHKCTFKEDGCEACGARLHHATSEEGRSDLEAYLVSIGADAGVGAAAQEDADHGDGAEEDSKDPTALTSIAVASSASWSSSFARNLQWQSVDDDFTLVWAMNVSHGASDLYVAPRAHFSDGCLDLAFVRAISSWSIAKLFVQMETGGHVDHDDMSTVKVKGLRLTPHPSAPRSELNVDGERLPYKPIELRVFRGVLNVLAR